MSTLLETSGGGIDLTQLSNIERWLLGQVGTEHWRSGSGTEYIGRRYISSSEWVYDFPATNIYSITIECKDVSMSSQHSSIALSLRDSSVQVIRGQTTEWILTDADRSSDRSSLELSFMDTGYTVWEITAFKTMDGKVHTKDNPNY